MNCMNIIITVQTCVQPISERVGLCGNALYSYAGGTLLVPAEHHISCGGCRGFSHPFQLSADKFPVLGYVPLLYESFPIPHSPVILLTTSLYYITGVSNPQLACLSSAASGRVC